MINDEPTAPEWFMKLERAHSRIRKMVSLFPDKFIKEWTVPGHPYYGYRWKRK